MIKGAAPCLLVFSLVQPGLLLAAPPAESVYKISPIVDGTIIGATAAGTLVPQALSSRLFSPSCPCDSSQVNGLDRPTIGNNSQAAATMSDITLGAALLVPPILDYISIGARSAFIEDLLVYSEVLTVNGAFLTLSKFTVNRPVPLVYSGDLPRDDPNGYASFYSGHTSLTFAALSASAVTLNLRYHLGAWPWFVVAGVGASMAYERVAAGRHFPTDVMMGALAGTLTGTMIPMLHTRPQGVQAVTMALTENGFSLNWKYRF